MGAQSTTSAGSGSDDDAETGAGSSEDDEPDEPDEGCIRLDPNRLDHNELFACDPQTDRGASRQRVRLVDGQYWAGMLKRAFGSAVEHLQAPNPFASTGVDGRFPFRTYAGDYTLADANFALLMGQLEELVVWLKTRNKWSDCFAQLDEVCVRERLSELGQRMFRRTLTEPELDRYVALVLDSAADLGDEQALGLGVEAIVVSPYSLFLTELGDPASVDEEGRVRLAPHEIADAIAYTIEGRPNPQLSAAAEQGGLATREQVEAHVRELLDAKLEANGGGNNRLTQFMRDWLGYAAVANVVRDDANNDNGKPSAMTAPTDRVLAHKLAQRASFIDALLLDPMVDVSEDGEPVDPPPQEQRVGFLTERSFLTLWAHQSQTDPIRRGKLVRNQLLCEVIPELPLGVVVDLPGPEAGTMRERLAEHRADPGCAACHELMDPIGLPLERYDHIGRFRELENGAPVVTSGELIGTADADGTVADARALSERLADSTEVRHCVVRNTFRGFMGRDEAYPDACGLSELEQVYLETEGDLTEVIVALLTSDEFLYRFPAAETCNPDADD